MTDIISAHNESLDMACKAADAALEKHGDRFPCGFAWVVAMVDGRSKVGKALAKIGFTKNYGSRGLMLWNPAKAPVQSVDILEAGANAYATNMHQRLGIEIYAQSRLD
jgi:hypothetical protein